MSKQVKEYLSSLKKRYKKTGKKEKMVILDEFVKTAGYDRKYAAELLRGAYNYVKGGIYRPHKVYCPEDADILEQVAELLGWICSKRMKPQLKLAVDQLIKASKLELSKEDRSRIVKISPATIDRLMKKYRKRPKLKGRSYTKSRARQTNDNALVESKNGSIIRKHMGYFYINQKYATEINDFYLKVFNPYLNFHRPCGFATITTNSKGKQKKIYKNYLTPYEALKNIPNAKKYLKEGTTFRKLDQISMQQSDNDYASIMDEEKTKLFEKISLKPIDF